MVYCTQMGAINPTNCEHICSFHTHTNAHAHQKTVFFADVALCNFLKANIPLRRRAACQCRLHGCMSHTSSLSFSLSHPYEAACSSQRESEKSGGESSSYLSLLEASVKMLLVTTKYVLPDSESVQDHNLWHELTFSFWISDELKK